MRISDWSSDVCSSDLEQRIVIIANLGLPARDRRGAGIIGRDHLGQLAARCGLAAQILQITLAKGHVHRGRLEVAERSDCAFPARSEEHPSELQSLMRISYAVFCFTQKKRECDNR